MELFRLFGSILITDKDAIDALKNVDKKGKDSESKLTKVFGNIGKASVAVGGAIVAGLGAALVTGAKDAMEAEEKIAQLQAVLKSTGGVSGMTEKALLDMADGFEQTTKFSAESVIEAQSLLLTFTKIGKDTFPRATQAAADMATAMGTDMAGQSIALGKALNDPVAGVASLTRVGVQFTDEQKNMIEAMVEAGDVAGAQEVILKELETQFGGSAAAAGQTMGGQLEILKNSFGAVTEELATQLLPYLSDLMKWVMDHMPEIKETIKVTMEVVKKVIEGVVTVVGFFIDKISAAVDWVNKWNKTPMYDKNANVSVKVPNTGGGGGIGGRAFASGTDFAPGGLSLVGERGPELVNLPRGSQVFTNEESRGMMGVNVTGNTFVIREEADIEKVARKLHELTQRKSRAVGVMA